jgi:hypothetical protein
LDKYTPGVGDKSLTSRRGAGALYFQTQRSSAEAFMPGALRIWSHDLTVLGRGDANFHLQTGKWENCRPAPFILNKPIRGQGWILFLELGDLPCDGVSCGVARRGIQSNSLELKAAPGLNYKNGSKDR